MNAFGSGVLSGLAAGNGPLVDVGRIVRRTTAVAGAMALAGLVVAGLLGSPLAGLGVLAGVVLGAANNQAFRTRALRMVERGLPVRKRPLASSVLVRMAVVSVVVFYLIYALPSLGWGALSGIVLFQMVLLGTAIGSLWRQRDALT